MKELISKIRKGTPEEVKNLEAELESRSHLNEPFLSLREEVGWLTVESFEDVVAIQLPDDGGRWYLINEDHLN